MRVILVKLGGSLITDKTRPESPRTEVIARLAGEIARAAGQLSERLIVGHGSGSFGHVAARRYGLAEGIRTADQLPGVPLTQERAAALHRIVVAALTAAGALPFSIAPSSCVVSAAGRPVDLADEPLRLALSRGLLPVVYGDVVTDREWGVSICSTERLFVLLARRLSTSGHSIRRVLWLGETDGVWDDAGRTIPRISAETFTDAAKAIGAPAGVDVTGGMLHRVETALGLAQLGIPSLLLNGLVPGALERALRGEEVLGTEVLVS
ncbi:MAG TPA: isopentenyl phosphate kinase [Thermoanaerobaculia bacterium]|nr:isopentenyl phosphate kinase [Thermoanaerobaculia bacterium]